VIKGWADNILVFESDLTCHKKVISTAPIPDRWMAITHCGKQIQDDGIFDRRLHFYN